MNSRNTDFYKVGGNLPPNAPSYVKRRADDDLYYALRDGKFCYVLNSRQMGKSSLRVQTRQRLQEDGIRCAAIDLTTIGKDVTPEKWYRGIFYELVKEFNLSIDRRTWWDQRDATSDIQRLNEFVEEGLLQQVNEPVVIFIDEIDTVLSLNFPTDDFFLWIRSCYNQRSEKPVFQRLTFCLLGVANPSDFIRDPNRTPFNLGEDIQLSGFELHEAQPLARGLANKVDNPTELLKEVLRWTSGQPFLTQKLCNLIADPTFVVPEEEGEAWFWIQELVQSRIIRNWESQDSPEHLKTIRDRILLNKGSARNLLKLYQQILERGSVPADSSADQLKLRLSGLVVETNGTLKVYNQIYEKVFTSRWVREELDKLPPHHELFEAWLKSSSDKSLLLSGERLAEALQWAKDKNLDEQQSQFLKDSQREEELKKKRESQGQIQNLLKDNFSESSANNIYDEVISWTGSQPSLKEEVLKLVINYKSSISESNPRESVEKLIRTHLINNWEKGSAGQHLMEMRDLLIVKDRDKAIKQLENYKQVLIGRVIADESPEQQELLATELVINNGGNLEVDNRIYSEVFNRQWLDGELAKIIESKNLPNPWVKNISSWLLGGFLVSCLGYFIYLSRNSTPENPNPLPTASSTAIPEVCSQRDITKTLESEIEEIRKLGNPQSLPKQCQTQLRELELINAAIQEAKNNRVVPSSLDKLCQIADQSVNLKDAVALIQGWYQDKYWGEKVKVYLKQNPNCPAIKAFATQEFLGNP
jgi:hypothetical protein